MDEKLLKAIGAIAAMALWGWVVFYFLGGSNIMTPLLYQSPYGGGGGAFSGMGKNLPLIFSFLVFFMPVLLVGSIMNNKKDKKD